MTAQEQATDFEALGRQVWDAWSRQWLPSAPAVAPPPTQTSVPGFEGLRTYLEWMQRAASAMGPGPAGSAPVPSFAGLSMPGLGALPTAGPEGLRELLGIPAFGHTREQQAQQQALMRALLDYQQASARYQQLMARAQGEGAQRLQRKLAELGATAPTLKAMYDLWVDAVEEAYAEIALSDEFREAYAAQTNTQMQLRHLQRKQMEQWCREFSLPTRSEVDTLGQRVQELRRQIRRMESSKLVNASATDGMDVETPKRRAVANTRAPAKKSAKTAPRRAPRKSR